MVLYPALIFLQNRGRGNAVSLWDAAFILGEPAPVHQASQGVGQDQFHG